jgi:ketosteroid isomerase-like protein
MSQADVDLVRALMPPPGAELTALLRSDQLFDQMIEAIGDRIDPEVESVAVWQGGSAHVGIEGFRKLWLDWLEPWTAYHTQVEDVIDAGDRVVVVARDRGRREGVEAEVELTAGSTWEIRDGRLARVVFYGDREEALSAAGVEAR